MSVRTSPVAGTAGPPGPSGRRAPAVRSRTMVRLAQLGVVVVFVAIWQAVTASGLVTASVLPTPWSVLTGLGHNLAGMDVRQAFTQTIGEFLVAFVCGTGAGFVVGIGMGLSHTLERAYLRPLLFIMSTPKVVFLPIFTLILGLDSSSVEAFGAFEAFFYVAVNVLSAVALVDGTYLRVGRAYNAGAVRRVTEIVLPAAAPGLIAAVWFGVKQAMLGVIIAELYAATGGIGFLITTYTNTLHTDWAVGVIVVISVFAIVVGSLCGAAERRLGPDRRTLSAGREEP